MIDAVIHNPLAADLLDANFRSDSRLFLNGDFRLIHATRTAAVREG